MRRVSMIVTAAVLPLFGCQAGGSNAAPTFDTTDQKASYAIGLQLGQQLVGTGDHVDMPGLITGIEDALAEREPRIAEEELQTALAEFGETVQAEEAARREEESAKYIEAGDAYRAENGTRDGVTTTATGLQYEILEAGDGPRPAPTDQVTIHYRGSLIDGTEFDASYGGEPVTFSVGGVVQGFSEALLLMNVGSRYRIVIPGELAYGPQGRPPSIGPMETLIFEIELLEIPQ